MPRFPHPRHLPSVALLALLISACSQQPRRQAPGRPFPPPAPPVVAPIRAGSTPVASINRGLSPLEALWHVRAGLNVATLSCRGAGSTISSGYNRMLKLHQASFAAAHSEEQARFRNSGPGWQSRFDQHQTRLYNFFAMPRGQQAFCRTAARTLVRLNDATAAALPRLAQSALAEMEAPLL
jgi:hypothetical protein